MCVKGIHNDYFRASLYRDVVWRDWPNKLNKWNLSSSRDVDAGVGTVLMKIMEIAHGACWRGAAWAGMAP